LEKKPKFVFLFARSQRPVVKAVAASLKDRLEPLPAPATETEADVVATAA
jgi:hypothetical protein